MEQHKQFYQKWWFWVLTIIFIGLILFFAFASKVEKTVENIDKIEAFQDCWQKQSEIVKERDNCVYSQFDDGKKCIEGEFGDCTTERYNLEVSAYNDCLNRYPSMECE